MSEPEPAPRPFAVGDRVRLDDGREGIVIRHGEVSAGCRIDTGGWRPEYWHPSDLTLIPPEPPMSEPVARPFQIGDPVRVNDFKIDGFIRDRDGDLLLVVSDFRNDLWRDPSDLTLRPPPAVPMPIFKRGDIVRFNGVGPDLTVLGHGGVLVSVDEHTGYRPFYHFSVLTLIPPAPVTPAPVTPEPPMSAAPIPSLSWSNYEGELTLSLWLGGLCIEVATIYAADNQVTLWSWRADRDPEQIECRTRAEAIAVVRALIGLRCGGEVPDVE